ncbi:unnamed protein product [Adineta steineri]|uniref:Uncharacterized protein n=1 Tax=Adineta steineri TaxID=433720 RepID=A0A819DTJ9_9BILA|nr:unnamed protein product [Adineta steineri]CAF3839048.1 unnamed protein product [Adineta steineri]
MDSEKASNSHSNWLVRVPTSRFESDSFLECRDVAHLFNSPSSSIYAFIISSLPGYDDSEAPVRPGINSSLMACIMQYRSRSSYIVCGVMKINFLKSLLTASVRVVIVDSRHKFYHTSRTIARVKYSNINLW